MTGPSLGPLSRCPFAPCAADVMLVVEQATPGDDETTLKRIPQHRMAGEAGRFGLCPASLMVVPLDAYSRETLETQAAIMRRMLRDIKSSGTAAAPPAAPSPPRPDSGGWFRPEPKQGTRAGHGGVNVPQDGKMGQGVVPLPDEPHAGPGPGRASKPFQPTAKDIVERVVRPKLTIVGPDDQLQQGSSNDMSSNDLRTQLIALTTLAIEGFGQEQEYCAALTAVIETSLNAVTEALRDKQLATHSLALAAVGSRSDIPTPAADMISASSSVGSVIDEIERSAGLLLGWVAATHAYAASGAANARSYLAQI